MKIVRVIDNVYTRSEAISLMEKGHKISHPLFTDEEYVYINNNKMCDENGYIFSINEFFSYRTSEAFLNDWYIVNILKDECESDDLNQYDDLIKLNIPHSHYENEFEQPTKHLKRGCYAPIRNKEKISRNDYCPCGSGKKYKKCCG